MSIISDTNFPRYLTAGPGTGKTEVLINKIVYLLENESCPGDAQFAIITYTNKATDEMKNRLKERVYNEWRHSVDNKDAKKQDKWQQLLESDNIFAISTIHSFCYRLLRKYGLSIGFSPNFRIKSYKRELSTLIEEVLSSTDEALFERVPRYRLSQIIRDILRDCYNHGTAPDMDYIVKNRADHDFWVLLESKLLSLCIEVYERLEQSKQHDDTMTLNDLISITVRLLGDEKVAKSVASEYKYLFIDEFQDTNRSQLDIVRILINTGVKVFLIGDEKQSIYAFRGADIECSKEAKNIMQSHHGPDDFYINENFRTDQALLMKINSVFDKPFIHKGRQLSFPQVPLAKTDKLKAAPAANTNYFRVSYEDSVPRIVAGLTNEYLHDKKINYEDIFILCRTNYELRQISGRLRQSGIPSVALAGQSFFAKPEIIDTCKLFSAIIYKTDAHLKELIFTDYYHAIVKGETEQPFRLFLDKLGLIFREELIDEILGYIYQESGIIDYYYSQQDHQAIANLWKLKDMANDMRARTHAQPLDFLEYLEAMIESDSEEDEAHSSEPDQHGGKVTLLTIHKAKGLSLPIVIIPNIDRNLMRKRAEPDYVIDRNDKIFALGNIAGRSSPSKKYQHLLAEKAARRLEEEIRVLYVAMTRAKHVLIMTSRKSKKELEQEERRDKDYVCWGKWV